MLFHLRDLAEDGIVPTLVAYGPALEGALYYLATAVVDGRPLPPEPSRYAPRVIIIFTLGLPGPCLYLRLPIAHPLHRLSLGVEPDTDPKFISAALASMSGNQSHVAYPTLHTVG